MRETYTPFYERKPRKTYKTIRRKTETSRLIKQLGFLTYHELLKVIRSETGIPIKFGTLRAWKYGIYEPNKYIKHKINHCLRKTIEAHPKLVLKLRKHMEIEGKTLE